MPRPDPPAVWWADLHLASPPGNTDVFSFAHLQEPAATEATEWPEDRAGEELDARFARAAARLRTQPPEIVEAIAAALADLERPDPFDSERWGPPPDGATYVRAATEAAQRRAGFIDAVAREALSIDEAAIRLGIDRDEISPLLSSGELVAIEHRSEQLLPAWQFVSEPTGGVVPGLRRLRSAYPGDGVALTAWVLEPNEALGGRTPIDLLRQGEVDRVVAVATAIGA